MSVLASITEGWTGELGPFTLKSGSTPVIFNLTGYTVVTVLRSDVGRSINPAGVTRVDSDPATGKVYFAPSATDFAANGSLPRTYYVHFKATAGGKDIFFPNGQPDEIQVWPK